MGVWLYASGDGESNAAADQRLVERFRPSRARLTMIPASAGEAEPYYDEFVHRFSRYGCRSFHLLRLDRPLSVKDVQRALRSDLLYFSGGNTFHLLSALRRSGFGRAMRTRAEAGGLIAGHSAGAIVLTPNIQTAAFPEFDRDENDLGLTDLKALRLVDFEFFPHYVARLAYNLEITRASRRMGRPIYAVPDGSCIAVEAGTTTFFGPVWAFVKGIRFRVNW